MRATWVRSLGWEDPLEKEMTIHSSTIAWEIPWTEEPGRLQSMGSQRVGHDWATSRSRSRSSIFQDSSEKGERLGSCSPCGAHRWGAKDVTACIYHSFWHQELPQRGGLLPGYLHSHPGADTFTLHLAQESYGTDRRVHTQEVKDRSPNMCSNYRDLGELQSLSSHIFNTSVCLCPCRGIQTD